MATTNRKSLGEVSPSPAVPFSYAQAAKGMSAGSAPRSTVPSGSAGHSKDAEASSSSVDATAGAAPQQDVSPESENVIEKDNRNLVGTMDESAVGGKQGHDSTSHLPNGTALPPSPDFGNSSTSTLPREDDVSSLRNGSSESTWEVISQTSNTEKPSDSAEEKAGKDKGKKKSTPKEKIVNKPLLEAPLPTFNIWKQRAEEAKSKVAVQPIPSKDLPAAPPSDSQSKVVTAASAEAKTESRSRTENTPPRMAKNNRNGTADTKTGEKSRERKYDDGTRRGRRMSVGIGGEDKPQPGSMSAPLPSMGDSELWPTPLTAQDEGRKRGQDKVENKSGKDGGAITSAPKGKTGWINVPFEPTVVFKTPIPNTNSRRGGRGGRGRDGANRGSSNSQRTSLPGEKSEGNEVTTNGDVKRSGRQQTSRSSSPPKNQSGTNNDTNTRRESRNSMQLSTSREPTESANAASQRSTSRDWTNLQNQNTQAGVSSRNVTSSKPRQSRSADSASNATQPKEIGPNVAAQQSGPSSKEEDLSQNVPGSTVDHDELDGVKSAERRHSAQEGFGIPRFTPGDRRSSVFSYGSRDRFERGRGSGRGRNGQGFHHPAPGQPFANAAVAGISSASHYGLPRSPTQFQQDNFFGQSQQSQPGRSYRNPARAQSIASESFYGRLTNGYAGQPLTPLQSFVGASGQLYDFSNMYPMTAVPFSQFVDPFGLSSLVRSQLEYYFSIDNLIKDVYLRSHMDSKGFVLLSFIAQFNRLKQLTTDIELIKLAIQQSNEIEHKMGSDGKDRLRKREDWEKWVLPMNERDQTAQNDGPESVSYPPPPQPQMIDNTLAIRHPSLSIPLSPTPGVDLALQPMAVMPPLANGLGGHDMTDPGAYTGLQTSPTAISFAGDALRSPDTMFSPPEIPMNGSLEVEPDNFSDHKIPELMVLERVQGSVDAGVPSMYQPESSAPEQSEQQAENAVQASQNGLPENDASSVSQGTVLRYDH